MAIASQSRVLPGLPTTLQVLSKTRNEAAVQVLIPALDSANQAIHEGALRTLLDRRSPAGQREILKRLHTAGGRSHAIVDERRGRLTHALRDGLLGTDEQMCRNACDAILRFREYDLMPALITAAEDDTHASADRCARTLLALADLLYGELSAPRDYRDKRDPQLVRHNLTGSLEGSVRRFVKHRRTEVIEAFLVLANRDNTVLKQILQDPHHPSYVTLVDGLLRGQRRGIVRLLLSFLDDPHAPSTSLGIVGRRNDRAFIHYFLRKVGFEPSPVAAQNLKHLEQIGWIHDAKLLDDLDDAGQHSAVALVMASGLKRSEAFKIVEHLLKNGRTGGKRAAARALAQFNGSEANALSLVALQDPDPQVQATMLVQLRPRGVPGALTRLVEMVDSPHPEVRQAARESLSEFNLDRYLAAFDLLDDEIRRSTGVLVRKVNPDASTVLLEELRARSRTRRLRALSAAVAMQATLPLELAIIEMLIDEDHLVRAEAARALADCNTLRTRGALRAALDDRSVVVQEAAAKSLQQLESAATPATQFETPSGDYQ